MLGAGSNFLIMAAGHARASQNSTEITRAMAMNFLMYLTDHDLTITRVLKIKLLCLSKTVY